MRRVIFSDLCGTLKTVNSTKEFAEFVVQNDRMGKLLFKVIVFIDYGCHLFGIFAPFLWFKKISSYVPYVMYSFLIKRSTNANDERILAKKFIAYLIANEMIRLSLISRLKKIGNLYIVSSTRQSIVDAFVERFGLKNGSGNSSLSFRQYYFGNKSSMKLSKQHKIFLYITDSSIDRDFEKSSSYYIEVIPFSLPNTEINITKSNVLYTYIPCGYYLLSRKVAISAVSILAREMIPLYLIFIKNTSFDLMLLAFFLLYCWYEIPLLYNDTIAINKERNPTIRIEKDITYNWPIFVIVRVGFLASFITAYAAPYQLILCIAFGIFLGFIHSILPKKNRLWTFSAMRLSKAIFIALIVSRNQVVVSLLVLFIFQHITSILHYAGFVRKLGAIHWLLLFTASLMILYLLSPYLAIYYLITVPIIVYITNILPNSRGQNRSVLYATTHMGPLNINHDFAVINQSIYKNSTMYYANR